MSQIGKLSRGLKWYKYNRDLDVVLKPEVSKDADKMIDVNCYLDYVKEKNRDEVDLALLKIHLLNQTSAGKQSKLYKELKDKIANWPEEKPKEEIKSKRKK